jgi:hypothetical protein
MKRTMFVALAAVVLVAGLSVLPVRGQDTSPYLMGAWESGAFTGTVYQGPQTSITYTVNVVTGFQVTNPTTKPLSVYAVFWNDTGVVTCTTATIAANGNWSFEMPGEPDNLLLFGQKGKRTIGTAKFFAFPAGTTKLDPNAVIGGFQFKYHHIRNVLVGPPWTTYSRSNLKAVVVNSSTIGEFTRIPNACILWVPVPD